MNAQRHELILRIISEESISTQEALRDALKRRGCEVTQATLSRDLRKLSLIKAAPPQGGYRYQAPEIAADDKLGGRALKSIFSESVLSVDYALNTAVVKCQTGMAQAVCAKLDGIGLNNVVGTLAGDDTIFILMRTENDAKLLVHELENIISNQNNGI
jgi:transcriptional regulator of arginine metabolism